jgi:hypothetical protein
MPRMSIVRRSLRAARALTATAILLLVLAAGAGARPIDPPLPQRTPTAPTIVKEIVTQPHDSGPSTIVSMLIGAGAGAALISAGFLGVRVVTRTTNMRVS